MKSKKLVTYFLIFLFSFFLVGANFSLAEEVPTSVLPGTKAGEVCDCKKVTTETCRQYCGDYSLNEIVNFLPRVAQMMLGMVGSLALLMFIYGGLMIMLAGETTISGTEKTTKVNKGKDAIRNAIVGLIIVFASYMIIGFIFTATGTSTSGTAWSNTGWFENK